MIETPIDRLTRCPECNGRRAQCGTCGMDNAYRALGIIAAVMMVAALWGLVG